MGRNSVRRFPRSSWRLTERTTRFVIGMAVAIAVALIGSFIHPPYVINRAGPAVNTLGDLGGAAIIEVPAGDSYPTSGALSFTTVAQFGGPGFEINVWDLVAGVLDPEAEVVDRDAVFAPEMTRQELENATNAQMAGSQNTAEAVVFEKLGYAQQAVVRSVSTDGPANGKLREDDVITAVSGERVSRTAQVSELIQKAAPDKPVAVTVKRAGRDQVVEVPTVAAQGRRIIGVGLEARFDAAPKVTINAGHVGGPSAGMMFALGVYDKLTPGELTGGTSIAGTGTMGYDGTVGPIGGIEHKMVGAQRDGATWFLAPDKNCPQVSGNVPNGLSVVRVSTFTEAVDAVDAIAAGTGDKLPTCG